MLTGKIADKNTKQAVPFAFVGVENTHKGTIADVDGYFQLKLDTSIKQLTVFITGYKKYIFNPEELDMSKPLVILLEPAAIALQEIVIRPKENPAHELIRQLIRNRKRLDPRNLNYYFCETYSKVYFTMSDRQGNESYYMSDTLRFKEDKKLLNKHYLFFIETASEKKYIYKNIEQEKILASRVSGFKSAPFASLASQLQSFTFFDNKISVLDVKYVNPIMSGTFKRYRFEIADTIYEGTDTTILINFQPIEKASFRALKGTIYLNKNQYALARVHAEPANNKDNSNNVIIQQVYQRIDENRWFPSQLVTEILFNKVTASDEKEDKNKPTRLLKCVSKLYVSNVILDSAVKIRKKNIEVINEKGYENKEENFWLSKRNDSLSEKEKKTYLVIDSMGKAEKLEQKLKIAKILATGQIPMGPISFDLFKLMRVNEYEGFRLGGGLLTNDKLSPWFSLGGYGAYGFLDKAWKYGGSLQLNFTESKSVNLKLEAARDVFETANSTFLDPRSSFISNQNIRTLLVGVMDKKSYAKASFQFPINRFFKTSAYFLTSEIISPSGFGSPEKLFTDENHAFVTNEAGIQFKFWPGEKFTDSFFGLLSLGSKAPCFFVNLSKSIPVDVYGYQNSFDYTKVDIKIDHKVFFKVRGYFAWQIQAGKVFGDVPYSFQHNNNGSRSNQLIGISAENTFETAFLNEFISTQYSHLFFAYNTGRFLKLKKSFNPEIELVHAAGYGVLNNREKLTGVLLNDMSKIYTEAGIRFKNLYQSGFSSFGVGVFYRYGNYSLSEWRYNLVTKLVLAFVID